MTKSLKNIFFPAYKSVAVVSPAGLPDAEKYQKNIELLRAAGVHVREYVAARSGNTPSYLAANAPERLEALNSAINDRDVELIICSRGGFGSVHLLENIDYTTLQKRDLPIMGYSDITALHCAMLAKNAGTAIAGCNLTALDKLLQDDLTYTSHRRVLSKQLSGNAFEQRVKSVFPGSMPKKISAQAYAANLTVAASLCGTEYLPDFKNMILILEDINEPLYKIDRMLTQLAMNHVFDRIAALGCGGFSGCTENFQEILELFERFAKKFDVPTFYGFQFGHTFPMQAVNSRQLLTLCVD